MIVLQNFYQLDPTLCRDHGRALAKEYLWKTFVFGWWGVISFLVNFFAVYTDLRAVAKASALDTPVARPAAGQSAPSATGATQPGWYADPSGRHELRYFDGSRGRSTSRQGASRPPTP